MDKPFNNEFFSATCYQDQQKISVNLIILSLKLDLWHVALNAWNHAIREFKWFMSFPFNDEKGNGPRFSTVIGNLLPDMRLDKESNREVVLI